MRKTRERNSVRKLTVDIDGLCGMLSCGRDTARKIGECAGAKIVIGRRVLYSVSKIELYVRSIAM